MVIDAREIELQELFLNLKEMICSSCVKEVAVDVLVKSGSDSRKVNAFASMSGYRTSIEKKEGYYVVHISGYACCV